MADNFGLKIGLEGEKEFKKALTEINQSFKVLGSEMKLTASQFDKNDKSVQALSARNSVLNKEIEAQKSKIETLRAALKNASESFGETDRRTQNWRIQLNNAEAALNDMNRELNESESAVEDAGDAAEKSGSKFKGFGTVLKTVGTAMGAVVTAAGAAAVKLGKEVVEAYADYEQLVGGVDTLFKDSSRELQTYAAGAYKTAGMSANDYMETVTGFSASLIQSLGGDTEKAVKYADMAITDMSDNANKMGTDMSSIRNAYQGFAKQNYTMLDNLKLGYGGTKEEMERLLADAQAISGIEYDISSYADVVDAIHVIQTSMDITDTTAKEAEHTISGSINSMQAAIRNLIVGFGDANADIGMLCGNAADALRDVLTNITPVIENIIAALPTVLDALLAAVGELLPTVLSSVSDLFSRVLDTLLSLLPQLIPAAVQAVLPVADALVDSLPLMADATARLISALVKGIGKALPKLIPAATEAVVTIVQGLADNLPMLLDAALQLITGLAQGLLDALPVLLDALPDIITAIVDFLLGSIPEIIDAGIKLLTSLTAALPEIIVSLAAAAPRIVSGIVTALSENVGGIIDAGVRLFTALVENMPAIIAGIIEAVPQILENLRDAFLSGLDGMKEIGKNLLLGLGDGLRSAWDTLSDTVSDIGGSVKDAFCDFFGIHSPSREMAWMGRMLAEGLADGIGQGESAARDAVNGLGRAVSDAASDIAVRPSVSVGAEAGGFHGTAVSDFSSAPCPVTVQLHIDSFNNYGQDEVEKLTERVMAAAGDFVRRKDWVFA